MPLFSIITVTFNAAHCLKATLDSVASQSCGDYEYLVMDGGSTDCTLDMVAEAGIKNVVVDSRSDLGIYDAMNRGMGMASGKYFIFMNAGDTFFDKDTLAHYARAIERNSMPGIVYGQTMLVDSTPQRNIIGPRHYTAPRELTLESFSRGMLVCHQAMAVLRSIAPVYSLKYKYSADYEWVIRCLQHSRKNVYLDRTVALYLKEGTTTRHHRASLKERFEIMRYYYGTIPAVKRHAAIICRKIFKRRNG